MRLLKQPGNRAVRAEFSEPQLVELGYWIGFTFGGQRWLKTLAAKQGELAAAMGSQKLE